jgi:hypothetical protein
VFVCIAAISLLHRNINEALTGSSKATGRREPAALDIFKAFSSEVDSGSREENASK